MTPRTRSLSGALIMLVIIPAIIGLLACMPVPIGDSERSRIDPELNGAWAWLDDEDSAKFFVFDPYDKRTWLLTGVGFTERDDAAEDYDLSTHAGLTGFIETHPVGDGGVTTETITLYKVWRTKLGDEWFLTWEPKGIFEDESFAAEAWFVFRIQRPDANTLELTMISDKLFKDVEENRRAYERVIKKNARNPDLYDDETIRLVRMGARHFDFVGDLAGEVIKE